ncbi:MAG: hypothetical protein U0L43_03065 [Muribaculaceae bacterium]|nr:hypothetical protein [Muribaculaceae bacterium]
MRQITLPDALLESSGALRSLWLALMLRADENGNLSVTVKALEKELEYSTQKVRTLLDKLTNNKLINKQTTNRITNITICNFSELQRNRKTKQQTSNKQNNKQTTNQTELIEAPVKRFRPPTIEEAQAYISEKNFHWGTAEEFITFYQSKGWKVGNQPMKDWKAAMRHWEIKWTSKYGDRYYYQVNISRSSGANTDPNSRLANIAAEVIRQSS